MEGKTYSTATSPYKLVLNCSRFPNRPAHRRKRWEEEVRVNYCTWQRRTNRDHPTGG